MSLDFTLSKYRELCQALVEAEYCAWTIGRYIAVTDRPGYVVLLRHDMDRWPQRALQMARLESELGLQATYYARMGPGVFRRSVVEEIAAMGHEVGYHYETLARARGDRERAMSLFEQELAQLRRVCDVKTASMHGSPFSKHDNRDLWRHGEFHQFGLLGEAYLSLDYGSLAYLTDTGHSWGNARCNIRDRVDHQRAYSGLESTDGLVSAIRRRRFGHVCISAHPERWASNAGEWLLSTAMDLAANTAKWVVAPLHRSPG